MNTLSILCTTLLATAALCAAAPAAKPSILLIVSDDHGYGDVGVYGCKDIPTPLSLGRLRTGDALIQTVF